MRASGSLDAPRGESEGASCSAMAPTGLAGRSGLAATASRPGTGSSAGSLRGQSTAASLRNLREENAVELSRKVADLNVRLSRQRDVEAENQRLRHDVQVLEARLLEGDRVRQLLQIQLSKWERADARRREVQRQAKAAADAAAQEPERDSRPTAAPVLPDELLREIGVLLRKLHASCGEPVLDDPSISMGEGGVAGGGNGTVPATGGTAQATPRDTIVAESDVEARVLEAQQRCAKIWRSPAVANTELVMESGPGEEHAVRFGAGQRRLQLTIGEGGAPLCVYRDGSRVPVEVPLLCMAMNGLAARSRRSRRTVSFADLKPSANDTDGTACTTPPAVDGSDSCDGNGSNRIGNGAAAGQQQSGDEAAGGNAERIDCNRQEEDNVDASLSSPDVFYGDDAGVEYHSDICSDGRIEAEPPSPKMLSYRTTHEKIAVRDYGGGSGEFYSVCVARLKDAEARNNSKDQPTQHYIQPGGLGQSTEDAPAPTDFSPPLDAMSSAACAMRHQPAQGSKVSSHHTSGSAVVVPPSAPTDLMQRRLLLPHDSFSPPSTSPPSWSPPPTSPQSFSPACGAPGVAPNAAAVAAAVPTVFAAGPENGEAMYIAEAFATSPRYSSAFAGTTPTRVTPSRQTSSSQLHSGGVTILKVPAIGNAVPMGFGTPRGGHVGGHVFAGTPRQIVSPQSLSLAASPMFAASPTPPAGVVMATAVPAHAPFAGGPVEPQPFAVPECAGAHPVNLGWQRNQQGATVALAFQPRPEGAAHGGACPPQVLAMTGSPARP